MNVLEEINEKYFSAIVGGRLRFFVDEFPLEGMDRQAMAHVLEPIKVPKESKDGNITYVSSFREWNAWSQRRFYRRGFMLDPSCEGHTRDRYNLWRGYGVEPFPGDISQFRRHLDVVEGEARDYIWKWICWVVQNPADKPRVAVVLRGDEGVGKGFIGQALIRLFGDHAMTVTHKRHVTGNFNSHLRHICFLFADEADFSREDHDGALKTLITEDVMAVEAKGVDVKQVSSHVSLFMSTNREFVVPVSENGRRYVVADVSDAHKGDAEYWRQLWSWLDDGGASHLLHAALAEDLGDWHPEGNRVVTNALRAQKAGSLSPLDSILFEHLYSGECPRKLESSRVGRELHLRGETKGAGMLLFHRLKETSWRKDDTSPNGWLRPQSLRVARDELFPDQDWPDPERDWWTGDLPDDIPF